MVHNNKTLAVSQFTGKGMNSAFLYQLNVIRRYSRIDKAPFNC
jgi:hypothetical protein